MASARDGAELAEAEVARMAESRKGKRRWRRKLDLEANSDPSVWLGKTTALGDMNPAHLPLLRCLQPSGQSIAFNTCVPQAAAELCLRRVELFQVLFANFLAIPESGRDKRSGRAPDASLPRCRNVPLHFQQDRAHGVTAIAKPHSSGSH